MIALECGMLVDLRSASLLLMFVLISLRWYERTCPTRRSSHLPLSSALVRESLAEHERCSARRAGYSAQVRQTSAHPFYSARSEEHTSEHQSGGHFVLRRMLDYSK